MPVAMQEMRRVLKPGGKLLLTTDYYRDAGRRSGTRAPTAASAWTGGSSTRSGSGASSCGAPGFRPRASSTCSVDWAATKPRMRRYHGYPYTSVGVALVKE